MANTHSHRQVSQRTLNNWYEGSEALGMQTPSSGRSRPTRYENSSGRRQAAAPYNLPTLHESSETTQRNRPTGTDLGMAHIGANNSQAGIVQGPPPVVVEHKEAEPIWVQFGVDHTGSWACIEPTRSDSKHSDYYEVPYVDPERVVPPPPSPPLSAAEDPEDLEPVPSTSLATTSMLTVSTNPDVPRRPVVDDDLDTVSLGSE